MKNYKKMFLASILFLSLIFIAGCGTNNESRSTTTNPTTESQEPDTKATNTEEPNGEISGVEDEQNSQAKTVTYQGVEGKNALELLKLNALAIVQPSKDGSFVQSINGIKNSDKEFWIFYVNGEMASVASDKYITKDTDVVEWKYESF